MTEQSFEVCADWMRKSGKGETAQTFDVIATVSFPSLPGRSLVTVACEDVGGWVVSEEHGRFIEAPTP